MEQHYAHADTKLDSQTPRVAVQLNNGESSTSAKPAKRRLQRSIASCEQCRARRVRCNRLDPCDTCIKRNEVCSWVAAKPLQNVRRIEDEREANIHASQAAMEYKIQALEATVAQLRSVSVAQTPYSGGAGLPYQDSEADSKQVPLVQQVPSWLPTDHNWPAAKIAAVPQYHEQHGQRRGPGNLQDEQIYTSVRHQDLLTGIAHMEGRTADLPALKQEASSADEWLNNLMFTPPSITASQAIALLPPQDIAYPAYQAYGLTAHWYPGLPVRGLDQLACSVQAGTEVDYGQNILCNLASYLSVCVQGLQRLTAYAQLNVKEDLPSLGTSWTKLALELLKLSRFYAAPSFEAVRAVYLVSSCCLEMRSERHLTASFRLHALALHLAYECNLDEEATACPDLTTLELEERRRLLHTMTFYQAVFILEYGRKCGALLLTHNIKSPIPTFDDAAAAGFSPLNGLMQLGRCLVLVNKAIAAGPGLNIEQLLDIDKQINQFLSELPKRYHLAYSANGEISFPYSCDRDTESHATTYHLYSALALSRLHSHIASLAVHENYRSHSQAILSGCVKHILALHYRRLGCWGVSVIPLLPCYLSLVACLIVAIKLACRPGHPDADDLLRRFCALLTRMQMMEIAAGRPLFHSAISVLKDVGEECSKACGITVERGPSHSLHDAPQSKAGSERASIHLETAVLSPGSDILDLIDPSGIASADGVNSPQYSFQDLYGSDLDTATRRKGYTPTLLAGTPSSYDWSTFGSSSTSENCSSEPTPAEALRPSTTDATSMFEHFPWKAFDSALDAQDLGSCLQGWFDRQSSCFQ